MATITAGGKPGARPRKSREQSIFYQMRKNRIAYVYILPAAIVMAIITLYPILYGLWMSFTDFRARNLNLTLPNNSPPFVWFDNYAKVLTGNLPITNYDFWRTLLFNTIWAFVNVFFHVTIGVAVALLLNRKRLIGRRFYRAIFIIPWALPAFVSALIWRGMFNTEFGAINKLFNAQVPWLDSIASDVYPIPFIQILPLAFYAVLIANVWLGWPFMSVVATGALQSVPQELYEAATVDGATKWQQFWRITVPSIRPAMIPAIMLGLIWTFNQFNIIYFISEGGPYGGTEILVTQAYKLINPGSANGPLYGVAAAFSVVVFFILLAITLINNRITRATESMSY